MNDQQGWEVCDVCQIQCKSLESYLNLSALSHVLGTGSRPWHREGQGYLEGRMRVSRAGSQQGAKEVQEKGWG